MDIPEPDHFKKWWPKHGAAVWRVLFTGAVAFAFGSLIFFGFAAWDFVGARFFAPPAIEKPQNVATPMPPARKEIEEAKNLTPMPPPPRPARRTSVTSNNQSGGITAGTIGSVNLAPDVRREYLKELQNFYAEGGVINRHWLSLQVGTTDEDIRKLGERTADWVNRTGNWISQNITPAAAERFLATQPTALTLTMEGNFSNASQATYSRTRNTIPQLLNNLDALMRSDAMYPQKNP